ncbi:MAG: tetratricopeptide repeat protein, partial [Holophagales bacterium]|nr:tetratricopeptide repeat protein [Holophagales bacterium]
MHETWEDLFQGRLPLWLERFADEPAEAVEELLYRRFHHGHLQPAEPEDLLIDWLELVANTERFAERIDTELSAWLAHSWGGVPEASETRRWAEAWQCLANVAGAVDCLPGTVRGLRNRFVEARESLGPFSVSPSLDPYGRYLWALGGHQADRSLGTDWWTMCDLLDDVPFYHASYAIRGVAGLPPTAGEEGGGFRADVVHATVRLGRAFDRLLRQRRLQANQAAEEYGAAVSWALAAFPFLDRWADSLAPRWRRLPESVQGWLADRIPDIGRNRQRRPNGNPEWRDWKAATDPIVARLRTDPLKASSGAEAFLQEARAYAESSGESTPLNRALCRFSLAILGSDSSRSVAWAREARDWEPWNAYSWTTLSQTLEANGRWNEAFAVGSKALERFPNNVVAHTGLAELLRAEGRFREAEQLFRQTLSRFPDNVVAHNGLAELLRAEGRFREAEQLFRQTLSRFPDNVVAHSGLAELLRAEGRFQEAEELFEKALERDRGNTVAKNGLANVLRQTNRPGEAEDLYLEVLRKQPSDPYARAGLEAALQAQGKSLDELDLPELPEIGPAPELVTGSETWPRTIPFGDSSETTAPGETAELEPIGGQPASSPMEASKSSSEAPGIGAIDPGDPYPPTREPRVSEVRESQPRFRAGIDIRAPRARLLRREARRLEVASKEGSSEAATSVPGDLRSEARNLLEARLSERPHDVRALTEKGLLLLESGNIDDARDFLERHAERLPAAPTLWTSLGRAIREQAKARERRLDEEAEVDVRQAPEQLDSLDRA